MTTVKDLVIVLNSNLSKVKSKGCELIYRVIAVSENHVCLVKLGHLSSYKCDGLFLKKFTPLPASKKVSNREIFLRSNIDDSIRSGKLVRVDEYGIPMQMKEFNSPRGECPQLDHRRDVVEFIDNYWGDSVFWSREKNAQAVKEAANRFNVSENSVRCWFEMHKFYGGHENALMEHYWNKGAPGVSRRNLRDENGKPAILGRRTDSEKIYKDKGYKRTRLLPNKLAEYTNFIKKEALSSRDKFPKIFRRWIETQIAKNRDLFGNIRIYNISPGKLPSENYMKRLGRDLLKKFRLEINRGNGLGIGSRGGSSQDIVYEQLSVLDIDGTPADNNVYFGDDILSIDGMAKPTVLIAVDRASLAIVGWDVSFGSENGDAYLNCVFSAYTQKTRELTRWEVPRLKGMVYGCATEIFVDRGPGISMRTQSSLVDRLRTAGSVAEPGSPQAKGIVEQVMKYFQEELSDLVGSTFKTGNDDEDRRRRKIAKGVAVTVKQFMQALLRAISRRNLETDARHLLTTDMMKKKVKACPASIYEYNKNHRRGDAAWDWSPEEIYRRLCVSYVKKAPKGIVTLNKKKYTSSELLVHSSNFAEMKNKASVEIKTYEIPNAPFFLLWEKPDQSLGLLEATDLTKKIFEDGLRFEVEYQNLLRNHLYADAKSYARKQNVHQHNKIDSPLYGGVSQKRQSMVDRVEKNSSVPIAVSDSAISSKMRAKLHHEKQKVYSIASGFVPDLPADSMTVKLASSDVDLNNIDDAQDLFIDDC